jgi:prepilin-type N-terminal cleavage/methylation domain-containing protein
MSVRGFLGRYPTVRRGRGFTLVELAVVVLVVGLLIGSLLVPLSTQVDQRNMAETQRRLEDAREALIGFAIANQRFPCPASSASNGVESFCTDGDNTHPLASCGPTITPQNHGRCSNPYDGFVPGVQLGLNNLDASGYALDAWPSDQSRIRYAITPQPNIAIPGIAVCTGTPKGCPAFTTSGSMRAVGISALAGSITSYLWVCANAASINLVLGTCTPATNVLAGGNAVLVVYSLGKNGTAAASADELANLNGDKFFVSKTYSSFSSTEFDDQLLWVSGYTMVSRLVAAGVLP